jgi:hypothetical protein
MISQSPNIVNIDALLDFLTEVNAVGVGGELEEVVVEVEVVFPPAPVSLL